jgi:hypothetical protein
MHRIMTPAVLLAAVGAAAPAWASDGDIAILAELAGTGRTPAVECDFWQMQWNNATRGQGKPPFGSCQPPVLKVYAELRGASAGGITGVEYSVRIGHDGLPDPGYILVEVPTRTATVTVGSAFTPPDANRRGLNIAWGECQKGNDGRLLLATVLVIPTAPCGRDVTPPALELRVVQHWWPSNRFLRCPLFTLCDAPAYTKVCLGDDLEACDLEVPPFSKFALCSTSRGFAINGKGGPGRCGKGKLELQASWGGVKALYR